MEVVLLNFVKKECRISFGVSSSGLFLRRNKKDPRKNKTVYFRYPDLAALITAVGDIAQGMPSRCSHRVIHSMVPTIYGHIVIGYEPYMYGWTTALMLRQKQGVAIEYEHVKEFQAWLKDCALYLEQLARRFGQAGELGRG